MDVVLVPSRFESFSFVSAESMSCGTPVVAFAQGGCVDIIDHKQTGYLAQPYDTTDFREGILWCLDNSKKCSPAAIDKVNDNFSMRVVAQTYEDIYNEQLVEF